MCVRKSRVLAQGMCAALFLLCSPLSAQGTIEAGPGAQSAMATEHIQLMVSEQAVLSAVGVRSYSEGARGVVDVRLTRAGDQFVLVGLQSGTSTLLLIMEDGQKRQIKIDVVDPNAPVHEEKTEEQVQRKDNIRLDFYFVQLSRANNHRLGVQPPDSISLGRFDATFDFMTQRFGSATAVIENQALLRLDMAQASGWAKLMRKAAVITENGQQARFYGGGEVNIPVQGSISTGIYAIEYGSTILVLPRYDKQSGRLQLALTAEVSDLTDDQGSGAPGRVRSTLNTVVNLEAGQAIVLAGLSSESKLKSQSGIPFLSQIPIFGLLFGSQRMTHQAADNVVLIVPSVVDATTEEAKEHVKSAFLAYKNYSGQTKVREQVRRTWEVNDAPSK